MPGWLQAFVKVNPITILVDAVRSVMAGTPDAGPILWTFVASAVCIAVFGSLTMYRYNRK
jgi:ABC-2 type transport system permease protein